MFMIPIGLYRKDEVNLFAYKEQQLSKGLEISKTAISDNSKEAVMKEIKYVVTNPKQKTRLMKDDYVFVLSKTDPGDPENWDNYNEKNKDMFDNNQNNLMKDINDMMFKQRGNNRRKQTDTRTAPVHSDSTKHDTQKPGQPFSNIKAQPNV